MEEKKKDLKKTILELFLQCWEKEGFKGAVAGGGMLLGAGAGAYLGSKFGYAGLGSAIGGKIGTSRHDIANHHCDGIPISRLCGSPMLGIGCGIYRTVGQ